MFRSASRLRAYVVHFMPEIQSILMAGFVIGTGVVGGCVGYMFGQADSVEQCRMSYDAGKLAGDELATHRLRFQAHLAANADPRTEL